MEAMEELLPLSGSSFDYDPMLPGAQNEAALSRWRRWLAGRQAEALDLDQDGGHGSR